MVSTKKSWSVSAGAYAGVGGEFELGLQGLTVTDVKGALGVGLGLHGKLTGPAAGGKSDLVVVGRDPDPGEYRVGGSAAGSVALGAGSVEASYAGGLYSRAQPGVVNTGTYSQTKISVGVTPIFGFGVEGKFNFMEFAYKRNQ
ncbi:hypothetical protein [Ralstonia syzygii]|uniref:hypothetical protein n=1 Tax=Ralstonia syzygii TaxID=28097 RepID=UPI0036F35528